jgi:hypothetical protein
MLDTINPETQQPPIAAGAHPPRRLLVAEHGTLWQPLAEVWREQSTLVSVLIQRSGETEPMFVRRLCAAIASAQLEGHAFDCAALVVAEEAGPHAEPARARLLQLLAQSLLRVARPIALQVHCPTGASLALCRSLERIQRSVAREFRGSAQFVLCVGTPSSEASNGPVAELAAG